MQDTGVGSSQKNQNIERNPYGSRCAYLFGISMDILPTPTYSRVIFEIFFWKGVYTSLPQGEFSFSSEIQVSSSLL